MVYGVNEKARKRVNGSLLSQSVGQPVCLLGEFIQMDPSGKTFKLKASDNQLVTVQVQEPVQDLLEGYLEVQGTAARDNTIQCQHYLVFPKEFTEKFDLALYNDAVGLMSELSAHYVIMK